MTRNKELFYWQSNHSWYSCDDDGDNVTLNNSAPERAKKSFEAWKQHEARYSDENNL